MAVATALSSGVELATTIGYDCTRDDFTSVDRFIGSIITLWLRRRVCTRKQLCEAPQSGEEPIPREPMSLDEHGFA